LNEVPKIKMVSTEMDMVGNILPQIFTEGA